MIECHESDCIDSVSNERFPDIVLILNETFADLNRYVNMEENEQIFSKFNEIDGIIRGYTVSSLVGGGTNNSEYELLTSNSMHVLNVSAPFLSLNMTKGTSIVSYLKELDYTTVGMPLTGYYKTIIELNEMVPIRTSMGNYMDMNGIIGRVVPKNEYYDII